VGFLALIEHRSAYRCSAQTQHTPTQDDTFVSYVAIRIIQK
jgi:hypothetical protein